jgi:hypothetical protein
MTTIMLTGMYPSSAQHKKRSTYRFEGFQNTHFHFFLRGGSVHYFFVSHIE